MKFGRRFLGIILFLLFGIGIYCIGNGATFFLDMRHSQVSAAYVLNVGEEGYVWLKLETLDSIMAGKPVNVYVNVRLPEPDKVKALAVAFNGAFTDLPSDVFSKEAEAISTVSIIDLDRRAGAYYYGSGVLTWGLGGDWDILISGVWQNNTRFSYEIKSAIHIAPPETKLQIDANNQLVGLTWVLVGWLPINFSTALWYTSARRDQRSLEGV